MAVKLRKMTSGELQTRLQKIIENVSAQLNAEAVKTICSDETSVPREVDITIHIGADCVTTIDYMKSVYVYPLEVLPSLARDD